MRTISIVTILICLLSVCSCGGGSRINGEGDEIERLCDSLPEKAVSILDTIDQKGLSEKDLNRYRLLWIKSRDKAFIAHTSDTLIVDVVDYYTRHRGEGLYAVALYYGGRVYSDLGDAPTALRYFQDALDALPDGKDDGLRAVILSQTGSLLNSIRLYDEAAAYLKKAIDLHQHRSDSLNAMRSIQLLGAVYLHAGRYDDADSCFREAREIGVEISHVDTLIQDMYLAGNELNRGNIGGALERIRDVVRNPPEKKREIVYAYASQIYLKAGKPDSAYLYAVRLIDSKNNDRRKTGYSQLLSPELRKYSTTDSLLSYSLSYRDVLDEYLTMHDAEQATIQTSRYNYQLHERERKKAEESKRRYMYAAVVSLILVLALGIGLLYFRNKKMKLLLDYHRALDNMKKLDKSLSTKNAELTELKKTIEEMKMEEKNRKPEAVELASDAKNKAKMSAMKESEEDRLRKQLKERLLSLQEAGEATRNKPEDILPVSVHASLKESIAAGRWLEENDDIWIEIENAVAAESSEFKTRLTLLIGGKMKQDVYRMALLVRCGFGPTETGILLGRTKGAVSSRRSYICEKIFGEKLGVKVMDDIINLL